MSRRESRVSINVRQNDALFEFENFKKKFLLANKHITKLNSTLSVRIEELNAQISTLYVENLRLRASEIALAAQLKREREKSRKVMADAEAATLGLTKHLSFLRESFGIRPGSPSPPTPPSQRATQRPPTNPNPSPTSPPANRISRAPNVPGIYEEEEEPESSEEEPEKQPSPARRKKPKPRLSASRLPLPSRVSSPPPLPTVLHVETEVAVGSSNVTSKRKPSRRQSGLLAVDVHQASELLSVPRSPSPAFGSPIRRAAGLEEEEEEMAAVQEALEVELGLANAIVVEESTVKKEKRKGKAREREREVEVDLKERERERKRSRDDEEYSTSSAAESGSKTKLKLKDVTNSPVESDRDRLPEIDSTTSMGNTAVNGREHHTTPPLINYLPSPRPSSSPVPPPDSTTESSTGGREKRARKSVNYAEPKLNTKMRKPDPSLGGSAPMAGTGAGPGKKRSSTASLFVENEDDVDAPLPPLANGYYSEPTPEITVVARSRTSNTSSRPSSSSGIPDSAGTTSVRKKKPRPQITPAGDDESDGAEADAEYIGSRMTGWVNVEGRRKSVHTGSGSRRAAQDLRRVESDDGRRHSMAV